MTFVDTDHGFAANVCGFRKVVAHHNPDGSWRLTDRDGKFLTALSRRTAAEVRTYLRERLKRPHDRPRRRPGD